MPSTPANAIDLTTTSAGIVLFNGTASLTTTAPTNHDLLVATGSNSITSVTPSTSGKILTSNGSSSDPSFQTLTTTSFTPNSTVNLFDDFMGANIESSTALYSRLYWNYARMNSLSTSTGDSGHPGVLSNTSIGVGSDSNLFLNNTLQYVLGGGAITLNWVFNIATLSNSTNRYSLRLGMGDTSNADQVNGCYVEYSDNLNSGNWDFKTAKASTRTTSTSSTAVTTGWHNLQITINAGATSVSFTMDGVSLGTAITTNIPTAIITPFFDCVRTAGTIAAATILVDLFYMTQTLTTPR